MQYISLKGVKKSSNESSNSLETRIIKEANTKLKFKLTPFGIKSNSNMPIFLTVPVVSRSKSASPAVGVAGA